MKKGVLLINTGSPDAMNVSETRKYLRRFLMDKRVIDINYLSRFLLVNGIIVPFRAPKSLRSYQKILIDNQSPLIYYSSQLENKLQNILGDNYIVKIAMLYGKPYLTDVLDELKKIYLSEIVIIPLYPQYASSTTGTVLENIFNEIKNWQVIPNIRTIHTFFNHPDFIDLWVKQIQKYIPEQYDFILFSYHGLPIRQIYKADKQFHQSICNNKECCEKNNFTNPYCYKSNCLKTTQLIVEQLNISEQKFKTCFQSRLGQSEWLMPYTSECIKELAENGIKKLVVVVPSFVTDCLETLFEINIEYQELFKKHGGENLIMIPSLNSNDEWVRFLSQMVIQ